MHRHLYRIAAGLLGSASILTAQLTTEQKLADFNHLAALYAKQYGPYEWKRDHISFDLLNLSPWIGKVAATKTDLEFYDVMSEYVSNLNDAHSSYSLPSNFIARLHFSVDFYDGKLLIDSVNRTRLPANEFPMVVGSELVSIDGVEAQRLANQFTRYAIAANDRSTRRLAADLITTRPQSVFPMAPAVPEISTVVVRRPDGVTETYRIPWARAGLPLTSIGRFPSASAAQAMENSESEPFYMSVMARLQNCRLPDRGVLNFGARPPVFVNGMGPRFTRRLGGAAEDVFYSGVFAAEGLRIGSIRIPNFTPASTVVAFTQFLQEITFFRANTDGLIVDVMRNPGGSVGYANQLLGMVIPYQWTSVGFELRATSNWVASISSAVESARAQGAPEWTIGLLEQIKRQIVSANSEFRGRTGPIPLDDLSIERAPLTLPNGDVIAYAKPLMLLVDEMSASAADIFAATIQDNQRGALYGWRTMGAGGNVTTWNAGSYSQGFASLTESRMSRSQEVVTRDFPRTRYVENVGVRPDIEADYMTTENLLRNGAPFVEGMLAAMANHIRANQ